MVQTNDSNNNHNSKKKKKTFKQINKRLSSRFCDRDIGLDLTGSLLFAFQLLEFHKNSSYTALVALKAHPALRTRK